ncbi:MAG: nucleotidyltransferase domain-containing protein [Pyrinomonadaceae bacterium]|nr:nucleotidyltransferase domain-containing protein [Pyrinomonadaceae bacterium]
MTPFGVNAGILGAVDLAFPYTAALSKTDGKVLSVLAGTTRPLGGREVARLAGVSQNGAWGALRRLVGQGVVIEQPAGGRSMLYTLNRDHIAAEPIIALTRLRSILIERLKEHLAGWEVQPIHASIFGSAARGDGDTESDIDILVIRPRDVEEDDDRWRSQIDSLAGAIHPWTGNHAGIAEISVRDLARLRRERPTVIESVNADGITLLGDEPSRLFRRRR